jgi:hypothetical protein
VGKRGGVIDRKNSRWLGSPYTTDFMVRGLFGNRFCVRIFDDLACKL